MKRDRVIVGLLATVIWLAPEPQWAQAPTSSLPEYTNDQRWGRLAGLDLSWVASEVALGKAKGMTVDEIGQWLGEYFANTWVGGLDARQLAISFRWNILSNPNGRVEMVQFTDSLVVARFNTPVLAAFGADRNYNGLSLDDYRKVFSHVNRIVADRVGVALDQRYDGDWLVLTMRNKYKMPTATAELRWGRASFAFKLYVIEAIRLAKAAGKTSRDAGLEGGRLYGTTWTGTDTPWRLFRGWAWNSLVDPNFVCEVQAATAALVKARCNRPWTAMVRSNTELTKVTVEDYEAYMLGLDQGVAEFLGMTWDVQMDGEWRVITVQRKR